MGFHTIGEEPTRNTAPDHTNLNRKTALAAKGRGKWKIQKEKKNGGLGALSR